MHGSSVAVRQVCEKFLFVYRYGCSTGKSKTPPKETLFYPLTGTEHGSQPSLTTRDRELVSVQEVRIEPGDLNPRPLTQQSVTLPTLKVCSKWERCILGVYEFEKGIWIGLWIDRHGMWQMLRVYGIEGKFSSFYVDSWECVRVGNDVSEWFPVNVGLRQGCVMSPWLFNVSMDGVGWKA